MRSLCHHFHRSITTYASSLQSNLSFQRSDIIRKPSARYFQNLGLNDMLCDRLTQLGLTTPTSVQCKAIPRILAGDNVVVAAETGAGKTLAFLLPIVNQLRCSSISPSDMRLPTALVLTTSQELVRQLSAVLHQIDPEIAQLSICLLSSKQTLGQGNRACPLLLATPGALLRATKPKDFAFTQIVAVDEADMLLSGGFEKETKQILATIQNQPLLRAELNRCSDEVKEYCDQEGNWTTQTQTIFSAATIPEYGNRSVRHYIDRKFPSAVFAITEGFHRVLPKLTLRTHNLQEFIRHNECNDEHHARCELLYQILMSKNVHNLELVQKTLVFTNSIASADALFDFLEKNKGMTNCAVFHKGIDRLQRQKLLKRLDSDDDADKNLVVICTDIAARGLDTTKVGHVVQFEFASDIVSYLHRIGRTGRAGTLGIVTSIESTENSLVLEKIREAGTATLQNAFSRKRSLRKKFKKAQLVQSS
ncbi:putative primosomal protein N' [Plasmopara halstedii]